MDTLLRIRYLFMSAIIKKSSYFTGRPAKFLLSKNHSEIKLNIFFYWQIPSFYIQEHSQKRNWKKIILGLQNGQKKIWLGQRKNQNFVKFLILFSLKKKHSPLAQAPKKFQKKVLELGSYHNLAQHGMCPIFFLKNYSTLTCKTRRASYCRKKSVNRSLPGSHIRGNFLSNSGQIS